jgi:hypothetical protein
MALAEQQRLWNSISDLNKHIAIVNNTIELVKENIKHLIGVDVAGLATIEDLTTLETSLKTHTTETLLDYPKKTTMAINISQAKDEVIEYVDNAIEEIPEPDLTNCLM